MKNKKSITLLGSTGSVGKQALNVARAEGYVVSALAAGSDYVTIEKQAREFKPKFCILDDEKAASTLRVALGDTNIKVLCGIAGIEDATLDCGADIVINAITGAAGLRPTMAALRCGGRLALANKESLVMAGELVMAEARKSCAEIIPVDSEHSAIFQCLEGRGDNEIKSLIITASGGPFFGRSFAELESITVAEALAHPTWSMGRKITIDSATLMNKGFEVIEAAHLFGVERDKIKVIIHRESIIHSMVEYFDNSISAQMSTPDMRLCVQYAVNYPRRAAAVIGRLDLAAIGRLTFSEPDTSAFPLLSAAFDSLEAGGAAGAVLNAANEIAVSAFLDEKIGFCGIVPVVLETLEHFAGAGNPSDIDEVFYYDNCARDFAEKLIAKIKRRA